MPLTGQVFHDALAAAGALGGQIESFDALAAGANDALAHAPAGLTPAGAAAFLATMAEESAHFRTTTEYGSGQRYAPWVGRTFEQLTWQGAYADFGVWCHDHGLLDDPAAFTKNPASLSDLRWAWLGGVFYFEVHGLWAYANRGDFRSVSQGVNDGMGAIGTSITPNGWGERQAMYRVFSSLGSTLLPATPRPPGDAMMLPPILLTDGVSKRFFTDTIGPPGQCIGRGWLILYVDGPDGATASCTVYPQHGGGGTGPIVTLHAQVLTDGTHTVSCPVPGQVEGTQLPAGTNQANLQPVVSAGANAYLVYAFTPAGQ